MAILAFNVKKGDKVKLNGTLLFRKRTWIYQQTFKNEVFKVMEYIIEDQYIRLSAPGYKSIVPYFFNEFCNCAKKIK